MTASCHPKQDADVQSTDYTIDETVLELLGAVLPADLSSVNAMYSERGTYSIDDRGMARINLMPNVVPRNFRGKLNIRKLVPPLAIRIVGSNYKFEVTDQHGSKRVGEAEFVPHYLDDYWPTYNSRHIVTTDAKTVSSIFVKAKKDIVVRYQPHLEIGNKKLEANKSVYLSTEIPQHLGIDGYEGGNSYPVEYLRSLGSVLAKAEGNVNLHFGPENFSHPNISRFSNLVAKFHVPPFKCQYILRPR